MKLKSSTCATFRVHDVEKSSQLLELGKTRDSIDRILRCVQQRVEEPVLACSGYNSNVKAETRSHAFIEAIHTAFALHLPLVLSPDMIWITILQGLAIHVHLHQEELRPILVKHCGRKELEIEMEIDPDSPESAWDEMINVFALTLFDDAGGSAALLSDFSTTGPVERLVSQVCVLDVFESFYEYIMTCVCGFPEITLNGTVDDWAKLRRKVELLEPFQIDFWLPHLRQVTDIFLDAALGNVDVDVWKGMYKLPEAYGMTRINGWIVKLIPYLQNPASGIWNDINPLLTSEGPLAAYGNKGIRSDMLPAGLSVVPFRCIDLQGEKRKMEMIGGFVGVEQDATTLAVQPKIGWAVRRLRENSWPSLSDLSVREKQNSVSAGELSTLTEKLMRESRCMNMPGDFLEFYKQCDGFHVIDKAGETWTIFPLSKVKGVFLLDRDLSPDSDSGDEFDTGKRYIEIGNTSRGERLLINTDYEFDEGSFVFDVEVRHERSLKLSAKFKGLQNFVIHLTEQACK